MSPPLVFYWKSALRLGTSLLAMSLTAPEAKSAAYSCKPRIERLPPPAAMTGADTNCHLTH